jgi:hypothetical protein
MARKKKTKTEKKPDYQPCPICGICWPDLAKHLKECTYKPPLHTISELPYKRGK